MRRMKWSVSDNGFGFNWSSKLKVVVQNQSLSNRYARLFVSRKSGI